MQTAYHFFLKHAGYFYNPKTETPLQGRIRCAQALAQAERDAERFGLMFHWDWDDNVDDSWMTKEERAQPHEWTSCTVFDPSGTLRTSLGGIVDATPEYRRVVEAELALEVFGDIPHR